MSHCRDNPPWHESPQGVEESTRAYWDYIAENQLYDTALQSRDWPAEMEFVQRVVSEHLPRRVMCIGAATGSREVQVIVDTYGRLQLTGESLLVNDFATGFTDALHLRKHEFANAFNEVVIVPCSARAIHNLVHVSVESTLAVLSLYSLDAMWQFGLRGYLSDMKRFGKRIELGTLHWDGSHLHEHYICEVKSVEKISAAKQSVIRAHSDGVIGIRVYSRLDQQRLFASTWWIKDATIQFIRDVLPGCMVRGISVPEKGFIIVIHRGNGRYKDLLITATGNVIGNMAPAAYQLEALKAIGKLLAGDTMGL